MKKLGVLEVKTSVGFLIISSFSKEEAYKAFYNWVATSGNCKQCYACEKIIKNAEGAYPSEFCTN